MINFWKEAWDAGIAVPLAIITLSTLICATATTIHFWQIYRNR